MQQPTDTPLDQLEDQPTLGDIRVSHSVVASIVRLAAMQVAGVCGVGSGFVDNIADLFSKKESDRGVRVTEQEDGSYVIQIHLVIAFGAELAKTAYDVQVDVRNQVMNMTGHNVSKVDVIIEGVKHQAARKERQSEVGEEIWPGVPHTD
jgi:uncharacterized alkaline shock family protein YloU